ncbi:MAG: hypothetical protein U5L74_12905 [Ideonella sp.]|nr:hypothetical protein [Ideonella sp.]
MTTSREARFQECLVLATQLARPPAALVVVGPGLNLTPHVNVAVTVAIALQGLLDWVGCGMAT